MAVFWNVTPCSLRDRYPRLEGTGCFHLVLLRWRVHIYSETLVPVYQTARRLVPEHGGSTFFRNAGNYMSEYTALPPRRQQSFEMEFCFMTKTLSDWYVLSSREFIIWQQNSHRYTLSFTVMRYRSHSEGRRLWCFRKALHIDVYGVLAGSVRRFSPTANSDSLNRRSVPILLQIQPLSVNERYYPQIDCTVCGYFPYFLCISHRTFFKDLTETGGHKTLSIWDAIFKIRLSVPQTEENYNRSFVIQTSWVSLSI
jgi:hypothetical protein